ncbi:MAG: hypothetical protein M3680_09410 [Myxococcota bacterium]|nr:hypothetical protein [Myxococcota bacterium]
MRSLALVSLVLTSLLFACGGDDDKHAPYDTYQACYDAHFEDEMLPTMESIVVCCLDHPIAGMTQPVCGDTEADCINYLTVNLSQTDADISVKTAACNEYVVQKSM